MVGRERWALLRRLVLGYNSWWRAVQHGEHRSRPMQLSKARGLMAACEDVDVYQPTVCRLSPQLLKERERRALVDER